MYQGMSGRPSLDLPQTVQIPPLEIASTMFKFPQRRVGGSGVKHVADYVTMSSYSNAGRSLEPTFVKAIHVELPNKGRNVGMLKVLPSLPSAIMADQTLGGHTQELSKTLGKVA